MARWLLVLAVALLTIYCVVEVAQSGKYGVRNAPKWFWAVLVICVPVAGPLAWLFFGRPGGQGGGSQRRRERRNPDDDPDFLRRL